MTVSRDGEVLDQMSFVHTGETVQTLDSDGNHVGYVLVGEDNSLQLTDEDGRVIRTLSPAQALVPQS